MRNEIHTAREMGRRYRAVALKDARRHGQCPNALCVGAINAAWRASVREHPDLGAFREQFVRSVRGVEVAS